jgi:hypothetical protein
MLITVRVNLPGVGFDPTGNLINKIMDPLPHCFCDKSNPDYKTDVVLQSLKRHLPVAMSATDLEINVTDFKFHIQGHILSLIDEITKQLPSTCVRLLSVSGWQFRVLTLCTPVW